MKAGTLCVYYVILQYVLKINGSMDEVSGEVCQGKKGIPMLMRL